MKIHIIFILIFISTLTFFPINNKKPIKQKNLIKNNELIRRKIMLIPFINNSIKSEYDYLSDVIRNALRIELENKDIYNFTDFSEIDDKIKFIKYKDINSINKYQLMNIAMKMSSDVIVIGSFDIHEEKILINIYAIDILTGERVIDIKKEGELGVNLLNLVDDVAKIMSDEMFKELTMIRKSYYDKKIKEQEEIVEKKLKLIENNLILLKINDQIIAFKNKVVDINPKIAQKILELIVINLNNFETDNFKNLKNELILKNGFNLHKTIEISKNNNANYLIISNIKKKKNFKKKNILIINTRIIDIKKNREVIIKNKEFNDKLNFKLKTLFNENKIIINEINYFQSGIEITIGIGIFFPFHNEKIVSTMSEIDEEIDYYKDKKFISNSIGFSIPFSFSYFPKQFFSIGFSSKIGYFIGSINTNFDDNNWFWPLYSNTPYVHDQSDAFLNRIIYDLSIKQKFGNIGNKFMFLLESGFELTIDILNMQLYNFQHFNDRFNRVIYGDLFLGIGWSSLIGFDFSLKKFSLESGCVFGGLFGWQSYDNYTLESVDNGENYNLFIGLEVRFNFKYFNYHYKRIKINNY